MSSFLAKALSKQPQGELQKMLADARAVAQRAQFEVELIEEAISAAGTSPNGAAKPVTTLSTPRTLSPEQVRERVVEITRELGPVQPKAIRNELKDESINVYNALGQLVKEGRLVREDGLYAIPQTSANGQQHPVGQPSPERPTPEGEDS